MDIPDARQFMDPEVRFEHGGADAVRAPPDMVQVRVLGADFVREPVDALQVDCGGGPRDLGDRGAGNGDRPGNR